MNAQQQTELAANTHREAKNTKRSVTLPTKSLFTDDHIGQARRLVLDVSKRELSHGQILVRVVVAASGESSLSRSKYSRRNLVRKAKSK
jgi:hypothetical protein